MMPVLDGYGVLHLLNKNPRMMHIPFIFLTAKTERSDFRKGMDLGADDYITKPFNGSELLNAVESRLKKSGLHQHEHPADFHVYHQVEETDTAQVLRDFVADRNLEKFKRKQTIYLEGNRPSRLFYIQRGKVKSFKTNDDGKELVVGLYKEGDFVGYIALIEDTPYKETAEAMEDTELALIPRHEFEDLLSHNHAVAQKFIKLLANNVAESERHLVGVAYNSLRKKVAEALITLQKKYKGSEKDKFQISLSRENLASIAGTATESLIRTLSDFKMENLIDIEGGSITILNEKKLENLLN
jgi:CRP/FNR family transcriptional regulator, cyclic AMP receptor protein